MTRARRPSTLPIPRIERLQRGDMRELKIFGPRRAEVDAEELKSRLVRTIEALLRRVGIWGDFGDDWQPSAKHTHASTPWIRIRLPPMSHEHSKLRAAWNPAQPGTLGISRRRIGKRAQAARHAGVERSYLSKLVSTFSTPVSSNDVERDE